MRTTTGRAEFVALLTGLLERAYLSRVDHYTDAQIRYVGVTGQLWLVLARLIRS